MSLISSRDSFIHVMHRLSWISCLILGLSGYLVFVEKTQGNVLNNFPQNDLIINFARLFFAANMFLSIPLECFVCREVCEFHSYFFCTVYPLISLNDAGLHWGAVYPSWRQSRENSRHCQWTRWPNAYDHYLGSGDQCYVDFIADLRSGICPGIHGTFLCLTMSHCLHLLMVVNDMLTLGRIRSHHVG